MDRVLAVVAHPDDEVLGIGGTLLRHWDEGDDVRVYIYSPCVRPASTAESVKAEKRMGIPYLRFEPSISEIVDKFDPTIVYTHTPADLHFEHREVYEATRIAVRPYTARSVRAFRLFETPSATDWGDQFNPNIFVDIGEQMDRKLEAMEAYASELMDPPHPRSLDALRTRAGYWGQQIGVEYAEAHSLEREVITWKES